MFDGNSKKRARGGSEGEDISYEDVLKYIKDHPGDLARLNDEIILESSTKRPRADMSSSSSSPLSVPHSEVSDGNSSLIGSAHHSEISDGNSTLVGSIAFHNKTCLDIALDKDGDEVETYFKRLVLPAL